ncbi:MAG: hypothetical protein ABL984_19990 [Pyrinomonadaceae bacterium]
MKGWITLITMIAAVLGGSANAQDFAIQNHDRRVEPTVFQAAGPNAASIQSTVDQFRAAIGGANNGNTPGSILDGRREINWDGGGSTATSESGTPFDGFLNNRGARFTTNGIGFVQATPLGLAFAFGNSQYESNFAAFSAARLFSPLDGNLTKVQFFIPGSNGSASARVRAFGAVFTDVDTPSGAERGHGRRKDDTTIEYLDKWGRILYRGIVPASPGTATLSFFGILLEDADIASVRIFAGDTPGPDDDRRSDIVMMDDFIYGEPQPRQ